MENYNTSKSYFLGNNAWILIEKNVYMTCSLPDFHIGRWMGMVELQAMRQTQRFSIFLVQISWIFFKRDHGVSHFVRVTQRDNFKVNSGQFPVVFVATKPRSDFHPKLIFSTGCWAISSCVCGDQYSHFKPNHAVSLTITSYFSCLSLTRAYPMKRPKPKLH